MIPTCNRSHAVSRVRFLGLPEVSDTMFERALSKALHHVMSDEERRDQLVSFVWGNALETDRGTKETVRRHLNLNID
jgi:hypothetical protein